MACQMQWRCRPVSCWGESLVQRAPVLTFGGALGREQAASLRPTFLLVPRFCVTLLERLVLLTQIQVLASDSSILTHERGLCWIVTVFAARHIQHCCPRCLSRVCAGDISWLSRTRVAELGEADGRTAAQPYRHSKFLTDFVVSLSVLKRKFSHIETCCSVVSCYHR